MMKIINLQDIILQLPVDRVIGSLNKIVVQVKGYQDKIGPQDITWISDKNLNSVQKLVSGIVICSLSLNPDACNPNCTYLLVKNPRLYFLQLVGLYFVENEKPFISNSAFIDESVNIGLNVSIGHGVVLERNCSVGDYTRIDHNTIIKSGTVIGSNVKIGANNTIGGVGFGYERDESGKYILIPHIGNVVIEDAVEIGNNTAIDRAVLGSTIIRKNAKIDNLVHIAHGVEVGENSLVIANAMIAGSTIIGRNVWVAPSASILNKLSIGDDSFIGMGAVVVKSVESEKTVVGNPAKELVKKLS